MDLAQRKEAAKLATTWLVQAITHAHLDVAIKDAARQLLCVDTYTKTLQRLQVFDEVLRPGLRTRLNELGAQLAAAYDVHNLGVVLGNDAVASVAPVHPLFVDGTVAVEQTALIPCNTTVFPFEASTHAHNICLHFHPV